MRKEIEKHLTNIVVLLLKALKIEWVKHLNAVLHIASWSE